MGLKSKKDVIELKIKEMKLRDSKAKIYDSLIPEYQHYIEIATIIKKLDPKPGEIILDLGCGTGRIAYEIIKRGSKVIALDFSVESLKICKSRCEKLDHKYNIHIIRGDACNIPLKKNTFDKCISSQVLQHIPSKDERLKMIQEVYRVLKPRGKFVLTTYNLSLRKIIGNKKETPEDAILYSYRYSLPELKQMVSKAFNKDLKIVGILNLIHWLPIRLLNKYKEKFAFIDFYIERTPISYLMAHLLVAECRK